MKTIILALLLLIAGTATFAQSNQQNFSVVAKNFGLKRVKNFRVDGKINEKDSLAFVNFADGKLVATRPYSRSDVFHFQASNGNTYRADVGETKRFFFSKKKRYVRFTEVMPPQPPFGVVRYLATVSGR